MIDHTTALADPTRLAAIASYDLDNPDLRIRLDAVTAHTAHVLGQPTALVSIVLDSAQLIAASSGLSGWISEAGGTPVEWSFCANAVISGAPYLVADAAVDPLQHDNPLVTVDGIASYAGVPLTTTDGHIIGAHCVLGHNPHHFTDSEVTVLQSAADQVMAILRDYRHTS